MNFKDLRIKWKVLLGFLAVVVICVIQAVVGYLTINRTVSVDKEMFETRQPAAVKLSHLNYDLLAMSAGERGLINRRLMDPQIRQAQYKWIAKHKQDFQETSSFIDKLNLTDEEKNIWSQYKTSYAEWKEHHDRLLELSKQKDVLYYNNGVSLDSPQIQNLDKQIFSAFMDSRKSFLACKELSDKLFDVNEKNIEGLKEKYTVIYSTFNWTSLFAAIIAATLSILIGFFVAKAITNPVNEMIDAARKLEVGETDIRISYESKDEIGELAESFRQTAASNAQIANAAEKVAAGDLNLDCKPRSEKDAIGKAVCTVVESIRGLVGAINKLSESAIKGYLNDRVDSKGYEGAYKDLLNGINGMLDTIVGHVDNIPAPAMIIDKNFNITYANDTVAKLAQIDKSSLVGKKCFDLFRTEDCNTANCASAKAISTGVISSSETVARPSSGTYEISYTGVPIKDKDGQVIGALEVVTDQTQVKAAVKLAQKLASYQLEEVQRVAANLEKLANGDLSLDLAVADADEDTKEIQKNFKLISENLAAVRTALDNMIGDAGMLMQAAAEGKLSQRADASRHRGGYQKIVQGVNDVLDTILKPVNESIEKLEKLSYGEIDEEFKANYVGEFERLKTAFENAFSAIDKMREDVRMLSVAALEGNLGTRADASKHSGMYQKIIIGLNDILDTVITPINEASAVLNRIANRDLTARLTGDFKGDLARLKESLNQAVENLDQGLQQVAVGADQVASASSQISAGSQELAQGASEQASSLEEVSSSLQEMSSMTKQNAANAQEAKSLAEGTKSSAIRGVESMQRLSEAIDRIKNSSDETAKIIKTIDEIAFQTNLLALNAAVEAARAGDAGKGFAVVAEEVRNLAMRSAEAAKNTANLIEESVNNSQEGVNLNEEVRKNLEEINAQAIKVTEVMAEIAAAADQQTIGIEQINNSVELMSQLTQKTAANSEESASASEELSGQSEEMRSLVNSFKLSSNEPSSKYSHQKSASSSSESKKSKALVGARNGGSKKIAKEDPSEIIPLDDDDSGLVAF